ncbi:nitroreductase family protein [Ketogulonicigenium vulgare]|uniref:Putative NAD(P)H nitroreductase n=1 Tax=Ketogulonicigenium vulgare (strain WSH-001) TaxID=759362 RepID=F9Y8T9_KETVW|nr:nitroreductase family protein [Ketogulonicigenium vulgare]ADO41417.1 Putative NAD(P)H nitroreductase [Ketogulonicigenium vulgare Y25]AEM42416.1 Nitroreductase family protein [Ketogulonicigenium vulgare WSH-001]ALJ80034.1 nitroreductase [Ketogulonicigenium vulgare]ANW32917.1 nitroreductase [Ketogulonicigenium vulgare]AOZ53501.1 NAD(P)H nitroreductase [Ketogulonicigenium vulgare]
MTQSALEFLLQRRSHPARLLSLPVPDADQLQTILTAAARTPDHGKLEPFRFILLRRGALDRLAALAGARGAALGKEEGPLLKAVTQFSQSPFAIAVVQVPRPTDKVPAIEQTYTAGAVALALLNAAMASGFAANWLTGWTAYDPTFLAEGLGLQLGESLVGFVHIGTSTSTPPERPRPDLAQIVSELPE